MKRKQSMAVGRRKKPQHFLPLEKIAGQWCPGWWRSVLVSLHGTAWSNAGSQLGAMRTSGKASMENVVFDPFRVLFF